MFGEMFLSSYKPYITTGDFSSGENKFLSQEVDDLLKKKKNRRGKNKDVTIRKKIHIKQHNFRFLHTHTYMSTHTSVIIDISNTVYLCAF